MDGIDWLKVGLVAAFSGLAMFIASLVLGGY